MKMLRVCEALAFGWKLGWKMHFEAHVFSLLQRCRSAQARWNSYALPSRENILRLHTGALEPHGGAQGPEAFFAFFCIC